MATATMGQADDSALGMYKMPQLQAFSWQYSLQYSLTRLMIVTGVPYVLVIVMMHSNNDPSLRHCCCEQSVETSIDLRDPGRQRSHAAAGQQPWRASPRLTDRCRESASVSLPCYVVAERSSLRIDGRRKHNLVADCSRTTAERRIPPNLGACKRHDGNSGDYYCTARV